MAHTPPEQRLISLDAFRGFTIAGMVLVNNPGDWRHLYSQLAHARWHGWTFTDTIFPSFLFICGVSMALSVARRRTAGDSPAHLTAQMLRRAATLFAVGLALNLIPYFEFATLRIPGVLQRIALCIAIVAPLVIYCGWRAQAVAVGVLLTVYGAVMLWLPVPDLLGQVQAGVLEPGRDAGAFIDRTLLGGHLWVQSRTWDPEGLLSTLPAAASLLFGVLTAHGLASQRSAQLKTLWMLLAGVLALVLGGVADAMIMPINKSLWTPSYCVFMTGWSWVTFAVFYWLADGAAAEGVRIHARRWLMPFTIYGMNALFIFAFSGLVARLFGAIRIDSAGASVTLKAWLYAPLQALPLSPVNASLAYALLFQGAMFLVAWGMWRNRWFVKV